MQKFFISILWFFNIIASIAIIIAYLAPFIDPSIVSFPAFFGLAFPFILFANVGFIILWLLVKWKYSLLSILLILIGYPEIRSHVQIFSDKEIQSEKGLKVLTYNVRNYSNERGKKYKSTIANVKKLLQKQTPDIICLQEAGKKNKIHLKDYMVIGKQNNFILTKLRVLNTGELLDANDNKFGLYADVLFDKDTIRVFNVQLISYSVSKDIEEYEEQPEKIQPKKRLITVAQKLKKGFSLRVNETYRLRKSLKKSPHPVILCGDFNDTPASYTYRQIKITGLKDSFVESGSGYGNTYNGYLPNIRIDYIFASKDFKIYNYKVLKTNLSDHFPVTAYIVTEK